MNKQHDGYEVIPFPKMRRLETNLARMSRRKNLIRDLVEVDVTRTRQFIREEKGRKGEGPSFTALIAACAERVVAENTHAQAYKSWRGQLVLFDDVDIGTLVEREHDGRKFPVAHLVRAAARKTVRDMHEEIRAAQAKPMSFKEVKQVWAITSVPSFVRQLLLWAMSKNLHLLKQNMGTVGLKAIGMFGNRRGWAIDLAMHSLGIIAGGIAERPALVDGKVEVHEYLCVTLNFDHDIIDGAPAARFTQRMCELIESGYSLYENEAGVPVVAQSPGSE